jgi:hypothetical protein
VTTQDAELEQRLQPDVGASRVRNYLKTLNMELTTIARACGKQNVHHLEARGPGGADGGGGSDVGHPAGRHQLGAGTLEVPIPC